MILPVDDFVPLCRILRPHSLGGDVIIHAYHDPKTLMGYGTLTTATGNTFMIKKSRPQGKGWVLHLEGLSNRNDAETLRGFELGVARSRLPVLDEDTWYHTDLIGSVVVDEDSGDILGRVMAVQNYGAGDFFDIQTPTGGEVTLPLIKDAVVDIRLPEKKIVARRGFCL
jgi:16S rRNA processing protein RimM